jgi:hypothetical protein
MPAPLHASAKLQRLKATKPREYAIRFIFGGLVTVGAGLVATRWGPVVGGLFLAFPSILPASLTLVSKHARLTEAAGADGLGAALGSLGLLGFALVVWGLGDRVAAPVVLVLAAAVWVGVSLLAWVVFQSWHLRRHHDAPARVDRPLLGSPQSGGSK